MNTNPNDSAPQRPIPNKLIPRSFRERLPMGEEIKEAKSSLAYWWYRALQLNDEYQYCCKHEGKGELSSLYRDFGDVFELEFPRWWVKHGRKIFTETKPLKKATTLETRRQLNTAELSSDKIIVEIPLTLKRQTAIRQVGRILAKAYEGRNIDVMKHSTARRKIVKNKIRASTIKQLLHVLEVRKGDPTLTLYDVGIKAGIELDLMARNKMEEITVAMERRRMTIALSRLLRQAQSLVENAGRGVFPSLAKPKSDKLSC